MTRNKGSKAAVRSRNAVKSRLSVFLHTIDLKQYGSGEEVVRHLLSTLPPNGKAYRKTQKRFNYLSRRAQTFLDKFGKL